MKFIDKYKEEHQGGIIGDIACIKCPSDFGYEPKRDCGPDDEVCHRCWNREMPEPKSTESKSEPVNANDFPGFEINDVVQLRNGRLYIILPNNRSKDNKSLFYTYEVEKDTKDIWGSGLSCLHHCCNYTNNSYKNNRLHDIVKLWRATPENASKVVGYFFNRGETSKLIEPFWVEPTAKKMTLKEIEKKLGYPVEIIPESESEGNES